ncbi:hypothetical protein [Fervidibacter sacchari]
MRKKEWELVEGQPPPPRKQALAQDGEGKQLKIGSCISRIGKTLGYLQGRIFMRLYPPLTYPDLYTQYFC